MSEIKNNIYSKLAKARVMLQEKKLKKSGKNTFSGFDYFELSDFLPAINDIFLQLGLCSEVDFGENEATLTITNIDNVEEKLYFHSQVLEVQLKGCTAIQCYGGSRTYTTRYLWLSAMQIVDADLVDKTSSVETAGNQTYKPKPKPKQVEKEISREDMVSYLHSIGLDEAKVMEKCGVNAFSDVPLDTIKALYQTALKKYGSK